MRRRCVYGVFQRRQGGDGVPVTVLAVRTALRIVSADSCEESFRGFDGRRLRFGRLESRPRSSESFALVLGCKQPVVAHALEALRKDMAQKARDEFVGRQGDRALAAGPIVSRPQADMLVIGCDDALVRDRDAMGVSRQIVEHLRRAAGRRFGVDHPFVLEQFAMPCIPGRRLALRIVGNPTVATFGESNFGEADAAADWPLPTACPLPRLFVS